MAKVIRNGGAPGVDGMKVKELEKYFERHRVRIIGELLSGTYRPQPVKRVEIPKPEGGVRKLGIPTAVDRVIQQAILQVLSRQWDETFSDNSFGFRPLIALLMMPWLAPRVIWKRATHGLWIWIWKSSLTASITTC